MKEQTQFDWSYENDLFREMSFSHNGDSRASVRKVNRKGSSKVRKMRS